MADAAQTQLTLGASALLYLMARHFSWNVPAYPTGVWYFNPFAWQFLFTFGAWFALGGSARAMPFIRSRTALVLGSAYLLFALMMTMAARFDELRSLISPEIYGAFNPDDKTNLAPYRLLHFVVFAFFVVRLLPRDWPGAGMADLSARNQMRSAVARSLLLRHILILCCTFRVGRYFRRYLDADRG
jgi:hypothetical protein